MGKIAEQAKKPAVQNSAALSFGLLFHEQRLTSLKDLLKHTYRMSESIDGLEATGLYASEAVEAGLVAAEAVKFSLVVSGREDFETEVFKSDSAFTSIPEINLEVCISNRDH